MPDGKRESDDGHVEVNVLLRWKRSPERRREGGYWAESALGSGTRRTLKFYHIFIVDGTERNSKTYNIVRTRTYLKLF